MTISSVVSALNWTLKLANSKWRSFALNWHWTRRNQRNGRLWRLDWNVSVEARDDFSCLVVWMERCSVLFDVELKSWQVLQMEMFCGWAGNPIMEPVVSEPSSGKPVTATWTSTAKSDSDLKNVKLKSEENNIRSKIIFDEMQDGKEKEDEPEKESVEKGGDGDSTDFSAQVKIINFTKVVLGGSSCLGTRIVSVQFVKNCQKKCHTSLKTCVFRNRPAWCHHWRRAVSKSCDPGWRGSRTWETRASWTAYCRSWPTQQSWGTTSLVSVAFNKIKFGKRGQRQNQTHDNSTTPDHLHFLYRSNISERYQLGQPFGYWRKTGRVVRIAVEGSMVGKAILICPVKAESKQWFSGCPSSRHSFSWFCLLSWMKQ